MYSFYMLGAQKHKKTVKLSVFLRSQDLRMQKLLVNGLVKLTPINQLDQLLSHDIQIGKKLINPIK